MQFKLFSLQIVVCYVAFVSAMFRLIVCAADGEFWDGEILGHCSVWPPLIASGFFAVLCRKETVRQFHRGCLSFGLAGVANFYCNFAGRIRLCGGDFGYWQFCQIGNFGFLHEFGNLVLCLPLGLAGGFVTTWLSSERGRRAWVRIVNPSAMSMVFCSGVVLLLMSTSLVVQGLGQSKNLVTTLVRFVHLGILFTMLASAWLADDGKTKLFGVSFFLGASIHLQMVQVGGIHFGPVMLLTHLGPLDKTVRAIAQYSWSLVLGYAVAILFANAVTRFGPLFIDPRRIQYASHRIGRVKLHGWQFARRLTNSLRRRP